MRTFAWIAFVFLSLTPHLRAFQDPPVTLQPPFWDVLMLGPCDELDPTGIADDCVCTDSGMLQVPDGGLAAQLARRERASTQKRSGERRAVLLHSGQEVFTVQDLLIRGIDDTTDFRLLRRYTSRVSDDGPFGVGWSHNYDQTIRWDQGQNAFYAKGFGREDRFNYTSGIAWEGVDGRMDTIFYDSTASPTVVTMRRRAGSIWTFDYDPILGDGRLVRVESSNGNSLEFVYEPTTGLLDLMYDAFGRSIDFVYGDPTNHPGKLTSVVDFEGRTVVFTYDGSGRLRDVRSPTSQGQSISHDSTTTTINHWPSGKKQEYSYSANGALTGVVYPNQEGTNLTQLAWTYYPSGTFSGWVHSHTVGNTNTLDPSLDAGGTYSYAYSLTTTEPGAAIETTVWDRRGDITKMEFNQAGQLLKETIVEGNYRTQNPTQSFVTRYTYNSDGLLTSRINDLGDSATFYYEQGLRASWASPSDKIWTPDPNRGGDSAEIRVVVVHEPVYNRPFKIYDPRGAGGGQLDDTYATTVILDYMEDLAGNRPALASALGISESELQQRWDDIGISLPAADYNGDGVQNSVRGNVVRINHPRVEVPVQAQGAPYNMGTFQDASQLYTYNALGQLIKYQDAEQNVTTYTYYAQNDPDGDGVVDSTQTGLSTTTGGYISLVSQDVVSSTGQNNGAGHPIVNRRTIYLYTDQLSSSVPGNGRGFPTAVINSRGVKTVRHTNELDQLVRIVRAAEAPSTPLPSGQVLQNYAYNTYLEYDANGNLIEEWRENADRLAPLGPYDYIRNQWEYDILDNLRKEVFDAALDPMDTLNESIENIYEYDESENLERQTMGVGTPEESITEWVHDERNRIVSISRGVGSAEASTITTEIDANGNYTAVIDAEGQDRTELAYDGYNRITYLKERDGTYQRFELDQLGNVTTTWTVGDITRIEAGTKVTYPGVELSRQFFEYDRRSRQYRRDDYVFHYSEGVMGGWDFSVGNIDTGDLEPNNHVSAVTITAFDRNNRPLFQWDPDGDDMRIEYDGLGRPVVFQDAEGNKVVRTWDTEHIVEKWELWDTSDAFAAPNTYDVFTYEAEYDSLNRLNYFTQPNQQTTTYAYDSHNNMHRRVDELGNHKDYLYDRHGRLHIRKRWLTDTGTNAGPLNFDGFIINSYAYDALHRLVKQTDDQGKETDYSYDRLGRTTRIDYADGTSEEAVYNDDGEIDAVIKKSGSVFVAILRYENDPMGRMIEEEVVYADPELGGSTLREWTYDGLGRAWSSFDKNRNTAGREVTINHKFDSVGRIIEESQELAGHATLSVQNEYQGLARLVTQTYASGRKVDRQYDGLDRLWKAIENSNASLIVEMQYAGSGRIATIDYGNGTSLSMVSPMGQTTVLGGGVTDAGYDVNGRPVNYLWDDASGTMMGFVNTYNGPSGKGTDRRSSELRTHVVRTDYYRHDSVYRIENFYRNNGLETSNLTWNGLDKLSGYDENGLAHLPVPDAANLHQYSSIDSEVREYDETGNLNDKGTDRDYKFDPFKRLVEHGPHVGATEHTYLYDSFGRRIAKIDEATGNLEVRYVYGGRWQVLEERDSTGLLLRQYVDGQGIDEHLQMTTYVPDGNGGVSLQETYYYHFSSQGFIGGISDSTSGTAVEYYEYNLFGVPRFWDVDPVTGNTTSATGSTAGNEYLFQGRRYDMETGFYQFRNRYYDPRVGEFISIDPSGLWRHGQGNGYSAFAGDPWNFIDPWGLNRMQWYGGAEENVNDEDIRREDGGATRLPIMEITFTFGTEERGGLDFIPPMVGMGTYHTRGFNRAGGRLVTSASSSTPPLISVAGTVIAHDLRTPDATDLNIYKVGSFALALLAIELYCQPVKRWEPLCFPEGTLVLMSDGTKKPIEEIEEEEEVVGWSVESESSPETCVVERTYINYTTTLIEIVCSVDVEHSVFQATRNHPFWVKGRGWVDAEGLRSGDILLDDIGCDIEVVRVSRKKKTVATYNLTVGGTNTFFITSENATVLVHNQDVYTPGGKPGVPGDAYEPTSVDKRRSELRRRLGLNADPDTPIPDQRPGRDMGGHPAKDKSPHPEGQRNVGAEEEHNNRGNPLRGPRRGYHLIPHKPRVVLDDC